MTLGKRWADQELPVDAIGERPDLQFRAGGLSAPHVNKLVRTLEAGREPLEPVRVARIGKALYLVDGHHRLEAVRRTGRDLIAAKVARMSLPEARDFARTANAKHGKGLSRADKEMVWQSYLADGRYLKDCGDPKSSRAIAIELEQMYSHETVRQKLKASGLELNEDEEYPGGYEPYGEQLSEEDLEDELAEELKDDLRHFGSNFGSLSDRHRPGLLKALQAMLAAIEEDKEPDMPKLLPRPFLDI